MNASLPRQLQEQLAKAEEIQKVLSGQEAPAENSETTPDATQPPVAEKQPVPEVAAPPAPEPTPTPSDDFKHKYDVLQGKYNAEVPRLHQQNRELATQLSMLQARVEELSRKPEPEAKADPLVTPKDVEDYGSDMIDLMRRVQREETLALQKHIAQLEAQVRTLAPKAAAIEQEVAVSREDRFWNSLANAVPDYEQINARQDWLQWLSQRAAPGVRQTRQDLLSAAQQTLDVAAVTELFLAFKQEAMAPAAASDAQARSELQRQVAPAKATASAVPQSQTGRMMSGADYAYWLDPRRYNEFPRADVEARRAEMEKALLENRIKW